MKTPFKKIQTKKMKKLIVLSAATVIVAATVSAQNDQDYVKDDIAGLKKQEYAIRKEKLEDKRKLKELEGNEVSDRSKQQFYDDFGNIPDAQWERTMNYDEATFTKNGQVLTAFYDFDSKLVGTTSAKTFSDIPSEARKYINEKYKDYSIAAVLFFDDNEANETDMVLYNQQFDDVDSYFVELKKDNKEIVLHVNMEGVVYYFTRLQ
jgi:hypothetical protein